MPLPRKYSAEVHKIIVDALADGNYRRTAAALAGITEDTLRNWLDAADEGNEELAQFAADVRAAETSAEAELVKVVKASAIEDWHAAAWILTHRHAGQWGNSTKTEITGANGGPLQLQDVTKLSDDELERRIAELSGARPAKT
jgi:transposase-like protein